MTGHNVRDSAEAKVPTQMQGQAAWNVAEDHKRGR